MPKPINREDWLMQAAEGLAKLFVARKQFPNPYRVTCGWPCHAALSLRRRTLGECHSDKSSADGVREIFISPAISDTVEVAGVLCHELIHACLHPKVGHVGEFVRACKVLGMAGKPRSAMPGKELALKIRGVTDLLGEYPHKPLQPKPKPVKPSPKLVRLFCTECPCSVWIKEK